MLKPSLPTFFFGFCLSFQQISEHRRDILGAPLAASDAFVGQAVQVDVQRGGLVAEVLLQLLLLLLSTPHGDFDA
jgi:hypothetical protein